MRNRIIPMAVTAVALALPAYAQQQGQTAQPPPQAGGQTGAAQASQQLRDAYDRFRQSLQQLRQENLPAQQTTQAAQQASQSIQEMREPLGRMPGAEPVTRQIQPAQQAVDRLRQQTTPENRRQAVDALQSLDEQLGQVMRQHTGEARQPGTAEGARIAVQQPAPQVTVRQPQPQVTVQQPPPQVTVQQPRPQVTVEQPQPQVTVRQAQPDVTVERQGQPQVTVQRQGEPQVDVVRPGEQRPQPAPARPQASSGDSRSQAGAAATGATDTMPPRDRTAAVEPQLPGGVRAESLIGRDVRTSDGNEMGEISNLVMDRQSGRIAQVIIAYGGFLGLGERTIAVPWDRVQVTGMGPDEILVDMSRQELERAPAWQGGGNATLLR